MAKKRPIPTNKEITDEIESSGAPEIIIADCKNIVENVGWKRLVEVLDKKIYDYEQEILNSDIQGEELNRLRDRRDLCLYFRNLPSILIAHFENPPEVEDTKNFDPWADVDKKENTA